jgi:integration host factor subunit beta
MTRSELIKALAKKHSNLFQKDIEKLVEIVFREIGDALVRGDRVELRGFGAFSIRERKPRKARNPKTGAAVALGARFSPYFRPGKSLRERLNKN